MTGDRWDVPNPRLARIAGYEPPAHLRECPSCHHRHPKGERCGHPSRSGPTKWVDNGATCRCAK